MDAGHSRSFVSLLEKRNKYFLNFIQFCKIKGSNSICTEVIPEIVKNMLKLSYYSSCMASFTQIQLLANTLKHLSIHTRQGSPVRTEMQAQSQTHELIIYSIDVLNSYKDFDKTKWMYAAYTNIVILAKWYQLYNKWILCNSLLRQNIAWSSKYMRNKLEPAAMATNSTNFVKWNLKFKFCGRWYMEIRVSQFNPASGICNIANNS